jgi:very-short-patch-repair endonuclease
MGALRLKEQEQRLLKLANAQFGVLRYEQLVTTGLGRNAIRARQTTCRLNRIHDQVYAFGHTALRVEAHWLAGLWVAGSGAALTHWSAGAYHGWRLVPPDDDVHVSVTGTVRSRDGLTVHRVHRLDRIDILDAHPLRVTHVPRTLVDLADVMDWASFRALADNLPSLPTKQLRAAQGRAPKRPGRGRVTRLIEADDAHTKSEFERRFLRFLAAHRLPRPDAVNERVAGHKADCVYRTGTRLVVELDGRAFHRRRAQMRADRARDTDYQLDGYRIMRLVWDDLHPDAAARTADRLARMLAGGRAA